MPGGADDSLREYLSSLEHDRFVEHLLSLARRDELIDMVLRAEHAHRIRERIEAGHANPLFE